MYSVWYNGNQHCAQSVVQFDEDVRSNMDTTHVVDKTPLHEHPRLTHIRVGTACFSTALRATFWDRYRLVPNEFFEG